MDARAVRDLIRRATTATLATLDAATGHPYASLVEVATSANARPILLLSGLARHTRNLKADPRASLLVDQRGSSDAPLATERAAVIGTARPCDETSIRDRYLARFPGAADYAGFGDFGFWVLEPALVHVIAGFGRIREIDGQAIRIVGAATEAIARREAELLAGVNASLAARGAGITAFGIDLEGVDVRAAGGIGRVAAATDALSPEALAEVVVSAKEP